MTEEKKDYVNVTSENEELKKIKKKSKTLAILVTLLAIIIIILAFYVYQLRSAVCTATKLASQSQLQQFPAAAMAQQQQPVLRTIAIPPPQTQNINAPFAQMRQMQQRMNQMFNDPFLYNAPDRFFSAPVMNNTPQIKFSEKPDMYVLSFLVPGMDKKDISIQIHNRMLTVTGKSDVKSKNQYSTSEFTQSINIPDNADTPKITSAYKNGILTVNIPKSTVSTPKTTSIPIS